MKRHAQKKMATSVSDEKKKQSAVMELKSNSEGLEETETTLRRALVSFRAQSLRESAANEIVLARLAAEIADVEQNHQESTECVKIAAQADRAKDRGTVESSISQQVDRLAKLGNAAESAREANYEEERFVSTTPSLPACCTIFVTVTVSLSLLKTSSSDFP